MYPLRAKQHPITALAKKAMHFHQLEKKAIFEALHRLILHGDILIWDPNTKELHGSEDIAGVSMNGDAIQISLVEQPKPRRKTKKP